MFFDDWLGVVWVLIMGASACFAPMVIPQLSGKRTLARTNAFDCVLTVALGSTLATIQMSRHVALAEHRACSIIATLEAHRIEALKPVLIRLLSWALVCATLVLIAAIWLLADH